VKKIISPIEISYKGSDADIHIVNAQALGESIIGVSKLYTAVAHYCSYGLVPERSYKKRYTCYVAPPKEGSYEYLILIAALGQEGNLYSEIYKEALSYLFSNVISSVKKIWTRKSETEIVVKELTKSLKDQAKINAELNTQLINALIKESDKSASQFDKLANLQEKLIETIPQLADATRNHGKQLVSPVGKTCKTITQFSNSNNPIVIDEPEAEAIRSKSELEIEDSQSFNCEEITEVNVTTGHCILRVKGFDYPITGKINDPVIGQCNNVYTRALNNKTSFKFDAKPVKRDGVIHRLYISDARDNLINS
jgi:hypothetical protein